MKYKALLGFVLVVALESTAFAGPESTIGGKKLATGSTAHQIGVGWPSIFYNWWRGGKNKLDWGLGGEFFYAAWNGVNDTGGNYIGIAFNAPLKWNVFQSRGSRARTDLAIGFKPGLAIGTIDVPGFVGDNRAFFGLRGELGIPVSIDVHERVNVITGATIPLTLNFIEDADNPIFELPIFPRIGVEIKANERVTPWFLMEIGPDIQFANGESDTELAFRIWVGVTIGSRGGGGSSNYSEPEPEPETL